MFLSVLFALSAAAAPASESPIIVTGKSIPSLKENLRACLARHCPADEDIDSTLALAEAQLLEGKYRDARKVLLDSLGRNKRFADAFPIPVSDLYRANGRVAASLGYDDDYYRSTWGIFRTLKNGLPDAKDRQYSAMMEVAEMTGSTRNHERARLIYERIADQARKDGRPDIAATAELRRVLRHYPPYLRESSVRKILAKTDPKYRAPILEGTLALARMAYEAKDPNKGDAIVSELSSLKIRRPILVYAPPYGVSQGSGDNHDFENSYGSSLGDPRGGGSIASGGEGGRASTTAESFTGHGSLSLATFRMPLNVEDMWMDVKFRVNSQGRVEDLQVLRHHGDLGWAQDLLKSIEGRRYTPAQPGSPLALRTERYTYTSGFEQGAGTRGQTHSPNARGEYMDLSDLGGSTG
jgi:hypothetical protein